MSSRPLSPPCIDDRERRAVVAPDVDPSPGCLDIAGIAPAQQLEPQLAGKVVPAKRRPSEGEKNVADPCCSCSQLLNFLGVIPLDPRVSEFEQRASMLKTAIGVFQGAVRTDPENADAKVNLEIVLRDLNITGLPPNAPSGEAAGGQRSSPGGVSGVGY